MSPLTSRTFGINAAPAACGWPRAAGPHVLPVTRHDWTAFAGLVGRDRGDTGTVGVGCRAQGGGVGSDIQSSGAHAEHRPPSPFGARLEHQLATAQQITHIGSWEWALESGAVRWSDELYRIYGLEPQSVEITLTVFLSKLHPDDRERVQANVQRAMQKGGRFSYVERIIRPNGETRYLDTVGEVVRDGTGRALGLIGTCRDVTEERERDETLRLYADIVQNVQIGLCVWHVAPSVAPSPSEPRVTLVAFNAAAEGAAGISLSGCIGKELGDVFSGLSNTELPEILAQVAQDGTVRELPRFRFARAGAALLRTFSAKAFPLPGSSVGLALEDVTHQARSRELQATEQRVLEMVASGRELDHVLTELLLAIEKHIPQTLGSILLLDAEKMTVRVAAAPHLPTAFNEAIDGEPIGPAAGSCGTAAYLKQAVFSRDIATDPLWEAYREAALRFGLRACWSTPILSSEGRVLGTFALYYREPKMPEAEELELISRVTHVAGIAIQRKQLDDRLRALTGHIEAAREEDRTAMAREIHDELGQSLTAMKMDVAWLRKHVQAAPGTREDAAEARMSGMSALIDGVVQQVRRISAELRPGVLDDLGLAAAIEWQTRAFSERSGVASTARSNVSDKRFERNLSTAVFRILQEALTNVARHAQAAHVDVSLVETAGRLRLEVLDDGLGITGEVLARPTSLGLLGMHERAQRLGGTLSISSRPGKGTSIVVNMPITPKEAR